MKRTLIATAGVLVLAMAVLVVGGAVTSAQEDGNPVGTFLGKVADKLGITEDELTTAIKDARLETVDEAVADGSLSEEQAARIKERIQESDYGLGFGFGPGRHFKVGACGFLLDAAAGSLGMEKDALVEALQEDGATLASVAEAQGKSVDQLKADILARAKADLDAKVVDKTLTQERADSLYSKLEENIDDIVNGEHRLGCHHRGPRRFHGGFRGDMAPDPDVAPPLEDTPAAEETIFY